MPKTPQIYVHWYSLCDLKEVKLICAFTALSERKRGGGQTLKFHQKDCFSYIFHQLVLIGSLLRRGETYSDPPSEYIAPHTLPWLHEYEWMNESYQMLSVSLYKTLIRLWKDVKSKFPRKDTYSCGRYYICQVFLEAFTGCCKEKACLWWVTGPLLSNGAVLHQFNALLAKCWSSWIGMRITLDSLPAQNSPLLIATDSVVRSFLNQTERRGTTRMPFITTSISLDMAFWNPIVNNTQSPPKSFPCLSLSLRNLSGMSEYIFLIMSDIRLKLSLV